MPSYDVASQVLGSAKGHAFNEAVDTAVVNSPLVVAIEKFGADFAKSAAAAELVKLGYQPTLAGAAKLIDDKILVAINATGLSDVAKTDLDNVLTGLFAIINGELPTITF